MKNKIKRINADWAEVAELACEITGTDIETVYGDFDVLEDSLYEKLNIDFDSFHEIVNRLLPLVDVGKSPLSGKFFKGFSKIEGSRGCWIVKVEI
ncbi:hypothetical protein [Capnocytophaga leadbetteri]|uniref:hypothetical protein n=1 Tax=Capnocytophaga leadbetteri TaxID=327575 RepID=UPI0028EAA335|nr:hypothetical protein [Capnocytophaga leadbetteri]